VFRTIKRYRGLIVAVGALAVVVAVFVGACTVLYREMLARERSDLEARAELAAAVLEEPLRTQDFRRIREFGDECRERGVQFSVEGANGGLIYWNMKDAAGSVKPDHVEGGGLVIKPVGDYRICVSINGNMTFLYLGALLLAVFALVIGLAAMRFVFFGFYRQRARIAEMKRLEKERYEFVTQFTHELKTPLTGIIAAADMMEGDKLADMIKSSAHRLDQLAQELIYVYWGRKKDDR